MLITDEFKIFGCNGYIGDFFKRPENRVTTSRLYVRGSVFHGDGFPGIYHFFAK